MAFVGFLFWFTGNLLVSVLVDSLKLCPVYNSVFKEADYWELI